MIYHLSEEVGATFNFASVVVRYGKGRQQLRASCPHPAGILQKEVLDVMRRDAEL